MRPLFQWNLGTRTIELGRRTLVMGVLNVTPDSFSEGAQFHSPDDAVAAGLRMLADGADILDIGGESTRPGVRVGDNPSVSAEEELRRVLPVLERLKHQRPDAIISIDTYKSAVAKQVVSAGAEITNDVSGLTWDPQMTSTLASLSCGVVLMHTRGTPEDWRDLPPEPRIAELVHQQLQESSQRAITAHITHDRIVLDPGFGFGKRFESNYPLLAQFENLHTLGFPLLAGASRKSFLGRTAGARFGGELKPLERLHPSIAAAVIAALKGAHIIRAHDVRPTVEALSIVDAVLQKTDDGNPWFDAYS
jgi:dihydropteroate synthase